MNVRRLKSTDAVRFIGAASRRRPVVRFCKFCMGLTERNKLVGVAIVARPRISADRDPGTAEILHLYISNECPRGGWTKLFRACWDLWRAMGGERLMTYDIRVSQPVRDP